MVIYILDLVFCWKGSNGNISTEESVAGILCLLILIVAEIFSCIRKKSCKTRTARVVSLIHQRKASDTPATIISISPESAGNGMFMTMKSKNSGPMGLVTERFQVEFEFEDGDSIVYTLPYSDASKMQVSQKGTLVTKNGEFVDFEVMR